jgi:hypothetical protein
MPEEETLELIASGDLDPADYEDYEALDEGIRELVENGDISVDEALEMG